MSMTIEELRDLRVKLGISQAALSKAVNYSTSSVSAYEKKARAAPYDFLTASEYFLEKQLLRKRKTEVQHPKPREKICLRELFGIKERHVIKHE